MTEPRTPPTEDHARPWWRDHLGWLLGGLPIGLALLRVAAVARFNPEAAGVIVSRASTLPILSGVFFAAAPLLLMCGAYFAWVWLRGYGVNSWTATVLVALPVIPTAIMTPVFELPLVALVVVMIWAVLRRVSNDEKAAGGAQQGGAIALALILGLSTLMVASGVWIPPEIVTHEEGETVGYVLGEEGGWFTVLRRSDREVQMLQSESVTDRAVCRTTLTGPLVELLRPLASLRRSLWDLIIGRPAVTYPSCPRRGSEPDAQPQGARIPSESPTPRTTPLTTPPP